MTTRTLARLLVFAALAAGAIVSLFPFYWMAVASTHATSDLFQSPPPLLPSGELLENLRSVQESVGFLRATANSLLLAVAYTALSSTVSAMCGYGLAKYRFRGRGLILAAVLATIMVPQQVLLVPLFQLMADLGWIDSYQAVVLPFLANAFGIFLMRQAFLGFPDDLIEAGRLDGASELRIFYRIVLPAVRPQLGALVIYTFITQWSAFIWPLLILNDESHYTIPVALSTMVGLSHVDYAGLMLGSLIGTLPVLAVFLAFQRQFVSGLLGGAVKG